MAKINFKIVENNTAPDYTITCTRSGSAINLTSASDVSLVIKRTSDGVITQSGNSATVTDAAGGVISYRASSADFTTAGIYVADIIVTWATGTEILYNQARWKVRSKIA